MPLLVSLAKTLSVYCLLQSTAFFAFFRLRYVPLRLFASFLVFQGAFFLGVFIFLAKNQKLFYLVQSGKQETVVNRANKITLFRITMLPFLVFLTFACHRRPEDTFALPASFLAAAFALTFASDFLDGYIARKGGLETYIGKILDSASDYLLLGTIAGAFFFFGLIRPWLFWLIAGRLFFNSLVMLVLFLVHRRLKPQTTFLGKLAIAVIMVILFLEAARPLFPASLSSWFTLAEAAAALVIVLSVFDKFFYLVRGLGILSQTNDGAL